MKRRISFSALLRYGLYSSLLGGVVGGAIGGGTYVLTIVLFGFVGALQSDDLLNVLVPENVALSGILYGYAGLCLMGIIGGLGLGAVAGSLVGPATAYLLYRAQPERKWSKTGAVIGGITGTFVLLLFSADNLLDLIQGVDTDVIGLLFAHASGACGGALGGTIAGARFQRFLHGKSEQGTTAGGHL